MTLMAVKPTFKRHSLTLQVTFSECLYQALFQIIVCFGLNVLFQNSYVEIMTPARKQNVWVYSDHKGACLRNVPSVP